MAIKINQKDAPKLLLYTLIVAAILLAIALLPLELQERKRVEASYSPDMEYNDKAYIDITYCTPKYFISNSARPALGVQYVVCEVQTVEHGNMLVAISGSYYGRATNFEGSTVVDQIRRFSATSFSTYPVLSFDTPYRLHCRVSSTDHFGLTNQEGDAVVLDMNYNNQE